MNAYFEEYPEMIPVMNGIGPKLIRALRSIVWYNGLGPSLRTIKNAEEIQPGIIFSNVSSHSEQFEIFWMLLVLLFGDYGTSPRFGWINKEQFKDACDFIDLLLTPGDE